MGVSSREKYKPLVENRRRKATIEEYRSATDEEINIRRFLLQRSPGRRDAAYGLRPHTLNLCRKYTRTFKMT